MPNIRAVNARSTRTDFRTGLENDSEGIRGSITSMRPNFRMAFFLRLKTTITTIARTGTRIRK
jgi:hypothetical protein